MPHAASLLDFHPFKRKVDLRGAILKMANLQRARLDLADLSEANAKGAFFTLQQAAKHQRPSSLGYALPLDSKYMRQLGRTDEGVDIETAPDGPAVYSITAGVVTAVANDPTGFGPNYPVIRVTSGPLAGHYIYYGHVAASLVQVGQRVTAGQPIAVKVLRNNDQVLGDPQHPLQHRPQRGPPLWQMIILSPTKCEVRVVY